MILSFSEYNMLYSLILHAFNQYIENIFRLKKQLLFLFCYLKYFFTAFILVANFFIFEITFHLFDIYKYLCKKSYGDTKESLHSFDNMSLIVERLRYNRNGYIESKLIPQIPMKMTITKHQKDRWISTYEGRNIPTPSCDGYI